MGSALSSRVKPLALDARHATSVWPLVSQGWKVDSSRYYVFGSIGTGPLRSDAHQRAIDEVVEKYVGRCDVLITSHSHSPGKPEMVLTATPLSLPNKVRAGESDAGGR